MTEELLKGVRRKHHASYGGGFLDNKSYQVFDDDYKMIVDEETKLMGQSRPAAWMVEGLIALKNTGLRFSAEAIPESPFLSQEHKTPLQEYSPPGSYTGHLTPWDASSWLMHWADQLSPKQTPEHFELSPSSERRTTGKVRKHYEPASFLFVDHEVGIEDTGH